jgi:hypothetical protein
MVQWAEIWPGPASGPGHHGMAAHPPKQGRAPAVRAPMVSRWLAGDEAARGGALGKHDEVGDMFEPHQGGGAHWRGPPHGSGS